MAWFYFAVSVVGAWLTYNAWRPRYAPPSLAVVSFFAGWLTAELALHHVAFHAIAAVLFLRAGALATLEGRVALSISIASCVFLVLAFRRGLDARRVVSAAVADALRHGETEVEGGPRPSPELATRVSWKEIVFPFPVRNREVERIRAIPYFVNGRRPLRVDVHRNRARPTKCPTLVYVHGGGWVIGQKRYQGLPLLQHLAARGWVCFAVDYRLSPRATFPDHLIDVKRAIAWVREHGETYGANPEFLVVSGNSAGAHLASLAALTENEPEYQPGFEGADTRVDGCIALYGVYDFCDRHRVCANSGLSSLIERYVMKASLKDAGGAYAKASPVDRIHEGAPPFFVAHGDRDTLAPVEQARHFCSEFRARARAPLAYAEIPGAQHAFEIFPSVRTAHLLAGISRFASHLHACFLARKVLRSSPLPPAPPWLLAPPNGFVTDGARSARDA